MVEKENPPRETTRRNVLKATSLGAITLWTGATTGTASTDDTVKITTVKSGDDPILRERVPRDWWDHELLARQVKKQIQEQYGDNPAVQGVSVGAVSEKISGFFAGSVNVTLDPVVPTTLSLPDSVDGVPVQKKYQRKEPGHACYGGPSTQVPGGAEITADGSLFSAGYRVSKGGDTYLLTCAHAVDNASSCDEEATYVKYVEVNQSGSQLGYVESGNIEMDVALVSDTSNDLSVGTNIVNEGEMGGHVGQDGLSMLKGDGETIYKRGRTTCLESGQLTEYDAWNGNCYYEGTDNNTWVTTTVYSDSGDSGAPIFRRYTYNNEDYVALIAPNYGYDGARGNAAYDIHDRFDVNFYNGVPIA